MISLKFNANEEIGNKYYKEYNCQFVPHLLFLDSNGDEVDRIIGFMPPSEYLLRLENIVNKRNTLADYLARYKNGEENIEIIAAIAMKYEDRKIDEKAAKFYKILISQYPNSSSDYYQQAEYFLASYEFHNGKEDSFKQYIKASPDSPFILDAFKEMTYYFADTKQLDKELSTYKEMLALFPKNPTVLNSYAWRMAEVEKNLEDALIKVRIAVTLTNENSDRQAGIIDTEAEVLWKLKRYNEAIDAINKSIKIDPENGYYKDQKEKFIQSMKEEGRPV